MTLYYLILFVILVFYLGIEYRLLFKSLRKIPVRILVSGTRGKSTTVKIIHQILCQSGKKVFAKTTGEQTREHLPDGRNKAIPRHAPASIIENVKLLRRWSQNSPDAAILECMALQPETHHTLAKYIFQPGYVLITNIYPDHREVMGNRIEEIAATIFQCIPAKARVFVTADVARHMENQGDLPEKLTIVQPETFPGKFDFIPVQVINQSWSLIRTLAEQLSIETQIVYHSFREVWLSLEQEIRITNPKLQWSLWNLFSVNDPQSTEAIIAHNRQYIPEGAREIVLFNARADRPLRTADFVNLVEQEFPSTDVWLTGSGRQLARRLFQKSSLNNRPVQLISHAELSQKLRHGFETPAVIYGIGNYYGMRETVKRVREMGT